MSVHEITRILQQVERGERGAADRLLTAVYDDLRTLAAARMAREPPGQTLQATALVHEAGLRLGADQQPDWQSRAQFFSAAAEAMRRILIDRARRRARERHGGGQERVDIDDIVLAAPAADDGRLLEINAALDRFAVAEPQKAELVKLRYFVGLTIEETAKALGISEATAKRWWLYARTWLYREISSSAGGNAAPRPPPAGG
jgi:RNA polymerase sigma factor (TIGR02999 family)